MVAGSPSRQHPRTRSVQTGTPHRGTTPRSHQPSHGGRIQAPRSHTGRDPSIRCRSRWRALRRPRDGDCRGPLRRDRPWQCVVRRQRPRSHDHSKPGRRGRRHPVAMEHGRLHLGDCDPSGDVHHDRPALRRPAADDSSRPCALCHHRRACDVDRTHMGQPRSRQPCPQSRDQLVLVRRVPDRLRRRLRLRRLAQRAHRHHAELVDAGTDRD